MKHKAHLRTLLVERGLAESEDEAVRLILAAEVKVEGERVVQSGALVPNDAVIEVKGGSRYVSRGGFKLEGALEDFSFDPTGLTCIDVGASSGGFTDCLLQQGAVRVTAVDVGYGQFDWKLRQDARVVLFERTNIARVEPACLGAPFDLLVADLSFTSLARLAGHLSELIHTQGSLLTLVKPQFELPKEVVKDGVVRSLELHVEALQIVRDAYEKAGLICRDMSFSHLLGPKGNTEFWIWAAKQGATATITEEQIVRRAHTELLG